MRPSFWRAACGNTLILDLDHRERLVDMNEQTKQLEDASHSFAAQVRYGCSGELSAIADKSSLFRPRGWLRSSNRKAIGFENVWALAVLVTELKVHS